MTTSPMPAEQPTPNPSVRRISYPGRPVVTSPDSATQTQLIERCFHCFVEGLHHADKPTLAQEAERLEILLDSPLVLRMRAAVQQECDVRHHEELVVMLRRAAQDHDLHHAAALAEINGLSAGLSNAAFRREVALILSAVYQVQDELHAGEVTA